MRKIFAILIISLTLVSIVAAAPARILAQEKVFTVQELSQFDGKDGRRAYYAYEGKVYDVTDSPLWKLGEHFGHTAGKDLTGKLDGAPHGTEVFKNFAIVGTLPTAASTTTNPEASIKSVPVIDTEPGLDEMLKGKTVTKQPWYQGRIRIAGISILGWTGILLGISFVLTFATCFAVPWGKWHVPWRGVKPGPDQLDASATHQPLTSLHKYFVWWTIVLGIIHGVLGLLQVAGIYL